MNKAEIDKVFCDLVISSQDGFTIDDNEKCKMYTLAYNDGLIAFRSAMETLVEQTVGPADDKDANKNT